MQINILQVYVESLHARRRETKSPVWVVHGAPRTARADVVVPPSRCVGHVDAT